MSHQTRLLQIWIQDRLDDADAVRWATASLKRITGPFGEDLVRLFGALAEQAKHADDLDDEIKRLWRLLAIAANDRSGRKEWWQLQGYRRAIHEASFGTEDVPDLIDFLRPRLGASDTSRYLELDEGEPAGNASALVSWEFETASGSLSHTGEELGVEQLGKLSSEILTAIIDMATIAFGQALNIVEDLGALNRRGAYITHVAHVGPVPAEGVDPDAGEELSDPDAFNHGFAPLVRLTTSALTALARKNRASAQHAALAWSVRREVLFRRLFAFAAWDADLVRAANVGADLIALNDDLFWDRYRYPEFAAMRALRWKDLSEDHRHLIAERLLAGPPEDTTVVQGASPDVAKYVRDIELARIVDHGHDIPQRFTSLVAERRAIDPDFPRVVPAIERPTSGMRLSAVPHGDATVFDDVPTDQLVAALANSNRRRQIGAGDDAEAFARVKRSLVLEALDRHSEFDNDAKIVWGLLLSWPRERTSDTNEARKTAAGITALAMRLQDHELATLADRLSYWLEAADELAPEFPGGVELWIRLLPFTVALENESSQELQVERDGGAIGEFDDLNSAALNCPLGRLFSYFLRRCPSMPHAGDRPDLSEAMATPLKRLRGRAQALIANRLVVHANYFWLADRPWLEDFVLEPMRRFDGIGRQLWEAFARYSGLPAPDLWKVLEPGLLERLAPTHLSTEAQQRLAEMAIIAWSSSHLGKIYQSNAAGLRRALTVASDEVRAATAWRLADLCRRRRNAKEGPGPSSFWPHIGARFFREVWPLEPALQSAVAAQNLARVIPCAGVEHFTDAVEIVLPYLRPAEIWHIRSLGFDQDAEPVISAHPVEALALINACISEECDIVFGLGSVLRQITEANPELDQDPRVHRLLRHVRENE